MVNASTDFRCSHTSFKAQIVMDSSKKRETKEPTKPRYNLRKKGWANRKKNRKKGPQDVSKKKGVFYDVKRILARRECKGRTEYLVNWKGYSDLENTWEPADNLNDAALQEAVQLLDQERRRIRFDGEEETIMPNLQEPRPKATKTKAPLDPKLLDSWLEPQQVEASREKPPPLQQPNESNLNPQAIGISFIYEEPHQFSAQAASDDSTLARISLNPSMLYSIQEFKGMWESAEVDIGKTTEDIEKGRLVRGANSRILKQDGTNQLRAQYGRILPDATNLLFEKILNLRREETFVDIGHGIGNTVLQAAHTIGCEARGIELVRDRNSIAGRFKKRFEELCRNEMEHDGRQAHIGNVRLRHGQLEAQEHCEFLTNPMGITKAFFNNFNEVFGHRSARTKQTYYLDDYAAGIFAQMAPGSIMVTLHPLNLGSSRSKAVKSRRLHGLPTESLNISFFEAEKIDFLGANQVGSWSMNGGNDKQIQVYRYTRLRQETDGAAVFLCNNPRCTAAQCGTPIPATKTIPVDGEERVVINYCESCNESAMILRERKRIKYSE